MHEIELEAHLKNIERAEFDGHISADEAQRLRVKVHFKFCEEMDEKLKEKRPRRFVSMRLAKAASLSFRFSRRQKKEANAYW